MTCVCVCVCVCVFASQAASRFKKPEMLMWFLRSVTNSLHSFWSRELSLIKNSLKDAFEADTRADCDVFSKLTDWSGDKENEDKTE